MSDSDRKLGGYLSMLLRHKPEEANLDMDKQGYVSVKQLLKNTYRIWCRSKNRKITTIIRCMR